MRLSLPSQRLVPMVLLGVLAIVLVAILAGKVGGGGSSGGDEGGTEASGANAKQLVQRAFSAKDFKSGKFNATAQVSLQQAPSPQLSSFTINLNGAFANAPAPPQADLDLTVDVAGKPIHMGIVAAGNTTYLTLGGRAYRTPQQASSKSDPDGVTSLEELGIDPVSWFDGPKDAGTATIDGVETNHVTAQLNPDNLLDDLVQLASGSDQGPVSKSDLKQVRKGLKGGTVDLYTAKSDGTIRRLSAQAQVEIPEQASGNGNVKLGGPATFAFDMQFTDVNKPQKKITAPHNARPAGEFESAFNSQVVRTFSRSGSPSGGGASARAEAPAPTLPGSAQKYLDCVEKARTNADVQKCAPLLD